MLRYNILTPASLLLATATLMSSAAAQDVTVSAGETITTGVLLVDGGSLTNQGSISNAGDAVSFPGPGGVAFILNESSGTIEAVGGWGIWIGDDLGRFENYGVVTTDTGVGLGVDGNLGSFLNAGSITGANGPAVKIEGTAQSFLNSGTLTSATNWTTTYFNAGVLTFENSGSILNTGNGKAVEFNLDNGPVGSFTNSGTISVTGTDVAVGIYGTGHAVGSINNSGKILATSNAAIEVNQEVGQFDNSGLIEGGSWDAVFFGGGVGTFHNAATGIIRNINSNGNAGDAVGFNIDSIDGGAVGSFINEGILTADPGSTDGNGVGFYDNGNGDLQIGSFVNSGTITGKGSGVFSKGGFDSFSNSGSIAGDLYSGIRINGAVGDFTNSGKVTSAQNRGIDFLGFVDTFDNSGQIESWGNGVSFQNGFGTANNSGSIIATAASGQIGVRIDEPGGTFTNTGEIRGPTGVVYMLNSSGANTFINAGIIAGDGTAINFDGLLASDDTLVLRTGSELYGDVVFGAGYDVLDMTDFRGNALLEVYGLEELQPGENLVFSNGSSLGVVEPAGITAAVPTMALDTTTQIRNLIANELTPAVVSDESMVMNYAPVVQNQASAAISGVEATSPNTAWASLVGGGSASSGAAPVNNIFGGIVAGSHAKLGDASLGLLGAVTQGRADVNNGGQIVTSTTGVAGMYGAAMLGVVDVDFSILAGVASNQSERKVVTPGGLETASADFSSWFLSPSAGIAVPVLSNDAGSLKVSGRLSYVGGGAAGYTETGSALNLVVGDQSISLLDARLGLIGDQQMAMTESGVVAVSANAGMFVQSNFGGSSTPVTLFGQTQDAVAPGSSEWGVYAGGSISADIGNNLRLNAGLDGQLRFDGVAAGSGKLGISAQF